MGYGQTLKKILDEKKIPVRRIAVQVGINPQTLYAAIKRDNALRYDHALRIANALDIDVNLICKDNPFKEPEVETQPQMLSEMKGLMTDINKDSYFKHRTRPLLKLFEYPELPQIDQIISLYYRMDDAHRSQFMDMGNYLAKNGSSPERVEKLKTIKKYRCLILS